MKFPTAREGLGWMTIPEMLQRSGTIYKDEIALQMRRGSGWVKFTYGEMFDRVKRTARYMREAGIKKGDRVSVLGENRPEWAISYLAAAWAGAIIVPIDARLSVSEMRHIMDDAEVKLLLASKSYKDDILEIRDDIPSLNTIVCMDEDDTCDNLPEIWKRYEPLEETPDVELDDLAVILYTSGTTGTSKGVMLTHKNIMSNVDSIYQLIDYGSGDTFFSILPLHHVFEATAGFLAPLYGGARIVYARSLKPNEMREDMYATKPTIFLVVPLLLEKIVNAIHRELRKAPSYKKGLFKGLKGISKLTGKKGREILFKSIREKTGMGHAKYIISGGAKLPEWISKEMEELGFPVLQGYGLSETAPVLTVNPPCCPRNKSAGLPIPNVEIKIIDSNDEGVGEIAAKGPNVMPGYYKKPEETKKVFTPDGWFLTGDLGYLDKDGYLYITGRAKSVIVTKGGKNIYPEEVEGVLSQSPYIEEILVLQGVNPKTGTEEIQAIVYPNYDNVDKYFKEKGIKEPKEEDVYNLIKKEIEEYSKQLADYKRPKRFTLRDEPFPKTTTNKIKRYLFEKKAMEL